MRGMTRGALKDRSKKKQIKMTKKEKENWKRDKSSEIY